MQGVSEQQCVVRNRTEEGKKGQISNESKIESNNKQRKKRKRLRTTKAKSGERDNIKSNVSLTSRKLSRCRSPMPRMKLHMVKDANARTKRERTATTASGDAASAMMPRSSRSDGISRCALLEERSASVGRSREQRAHSIEFKATRNEQTKTQLQKNKQQHHQT
jgi:hypothetical protein